MRGRGRKEEVKEMLDNFFVFAGFWKSKYSIIEWYNKKLVKLYFLKF